MRLSTHHGPVAVERNAPDLGGESPLSRSQGMTRVGAEAPKQKKKRTADPGVRVQVRPPCSVHGIGPTDKGFL